MAKLKVDAGEFVRVKWNSGSASISLVIKAVDHARDKRKQSITVFDFETRATQFCDSSQIVNVIDNADDLQDLFD